MSETKQAHVPGVGDVLTPKDEQLSIVRALFILSGFDGETARLDPVRVHLGTYATGRGDQREVSLDELSDMVKIGRLGRRAAIRDAHDGDTLADGSHPADAISKTSIEFDGIVIETHTDGDESFFVVHDLAGVDNPHPARVCAYPHTALKSAALFSKENAAARRAKRREEAD